MIGAKKSDWTVILHQVGRWEQFDGARMASRLSAPVVLFEGEDTSGSVQCTCYQPDGREERIQTVHDAAVERQLNEEFAEHVGRQPDSAQDPATEVESYDHYFESLGIIPLLVTENKAGDVLITPDEEKQISGIYRARRATTQRCLTRRCSGPAVLAGLHCSPGPSPSSVWPAAEHFFVRLPGVSPMSKRSQIRLSSMILAALILLVACYLVLVFYVPHLTAIWSEQGRALSVVERSVLSIGQVAQSQGFPLFGFLALLLVIALAWRVVAQVQWSRGKDPTTGST